LSLVACRLPYFVDEAALFAQLIARTAKDIDVLIDSLPSEDSSPELQVNLQRINNVILHLIVNSL